MYSRVTDTHTLTVALYRGKYTAILMEVGSACALGSRTWDDLDSAIQWIESLYSRFVG